MGPIGASSQSPFTRRHLVTCHYSIDTQKILNIGGRSVHPLTHAHHVIVGKVGDGMSALRCMSDSLNSSICHVLL